jgi:hypothetical protein
MAAAPRKFTHLSSDLPTRSYAHVSFAEVRELSIQTPPGIQHGPQNSIQKRLARPCLSSKVSRSTNSPVNWLVTSLRMPAIPKGVWINRLTSFFVKNPRACLHFRPPVDAITLGSQ